MKPPGQEFEASESVKQVPTNVVLPVLYRAKLRHLAMVTRVSQAAYIREALADLLQKYRNVLEEEQADGLYEPTAK